MAMDQVATLVIGDSPADHELKDMIDFFGLSDKRITVQLKNNSKHLKVEKLPCLILDGKLIYQYNAIAKFLAANSSSHTGKSDIEWNEIWQYLEYRSADVQPNTRDNAKIQSVLMEMNSILATRTFVVGFKQSLADIILYLGLYPIATSMSCESKQRYKHFSRWFDQNQYLAASSFHLEKIYFPKKDACYYECIGVLVLEKQLKDLAQLCTLRNDSK
ncbi:uncharacterized protein TRIADDRAFT_58127 [Trichoplax adhaerens]|uniref:Nuclear-export cofactor Arc1-like N-terminal domain-containing protein n=1 Tax=Trichoplax adhaerens TaxID=10228 RepID=B3S0Y2_TRIAD|nr:hypothetical protein TRIADDRAFT_58127 [Trichoplax adhaerens]EDV23142.1 hypothetical protein TRIADDRAFT_58127 [Trichoplax adhaerens]|eukprot:XP_002114052.1 hypothetical protein TRIADDRAFT_58127 [Trichoplax adhaerens]